MQQRQLGKNGPLVSVIGLGAWPIGGGMGHVDRQQAIGTIQAAIDNGITLIDTAQAYLASENVLGEALKSGYRERCFLATKASFDFSQAGITSALEDSLLDMGVDDVDLLQLHRWEAAVPLEEQIGALVTLQQQGKTRFIGVSNYNADQLAQAQAIAARSATVIQSSQPAYNMFYRTIEAADLPFCAAAEIGVLAHSPLAKGLLAGRYTPETTFPADDERSQMQMAHRFQGEPFQRFLALTEQLKSLAADKGLSMVQFAIAWLLRDPAVTCVLCGAKNAQQAQDYLGAVDVTFSADELAQIDAILVDVPHYRG